MNPNKKVFVAFLSFVLVMLVIACTCVGTGSTPPPVTPSAVALQVETGLPSLSAQPLGTDTPEPVEASSTNPPANQATATEAGGNSVLVDETGTMSYPDNDQFKIDLSQQQAWLIDIKQPGLNVAILPSGQLDQTTPSVLVDLTLTTSAAGQIAGVRCMFAGSNNYYQVALRDKEFAIGLMMNGKFTQLTSPNWKTSQFINANGLNGGADIEVACTPYGAGLSINGMGEIPLTAGSDEHYAGGQIALFAESGTSQANGLYTSATFASLKIKKGQ